MLFEHAPGRCSDSLKWQYRNGLFSILSFVKLEPKQKTFVKLKLSAVCALGNWI